MHRQKLAIRQDRARARNHLRRARLDQNPRKPGMDRQPAHGPSDLGHCSATHCTEGFEQCKAGSDRCFRGSFEPGERPRVTAPGEDLEQRRAEIHPADVGLAVRLQAVALAPQPDDNSRRGPPGAPGALRGGIEGDPFGFE